MHLQVKLLDKRIGNAFPVPSYATDGAAAFDLLAMPDKVTNIEPNERILMPSGISVYIGNPSFAGFIYPRSGLGHKHGIILGNGVGIIDSDYQGELLISLYNSGHKTYTITPGERVAQFVLMPVVRATLKVVDSFDAESERGSGGFGHTGTH